MANIIWKGSYYKRKSDDNFRQRGTGFVVGDVKVIQRKGQRGKVIVTNGTNYKGIEVPRRNVYGSDPKRTKAGLRKFQVSVNKNRSGSKKSRRSHSRQLR